MRCSLMVDDTVSPKESSLWTFGIGHKAEIRGRQKKFLWKSKLSLSLHVVVADLTPFVDQSGLYQ